MRWILYWLWKGEWPTVDHLGNPVADDEPRGLLADGYFGVVWGLLADFDYLFKVLNSQITILQGIPAGGARATQRGFRGLILCRVLVGLHKCMMRRRGERAAWQLGTNCSTCLG